MSILHAAAQLNTTAGLRFGGALAALLLCAFCTARADEPPDYYVPPAAEQPSPALADPPSLPPPPTVPLQSELVRRAPAMRWAPAARQRWSCPPISLAALLHVGIGGVIGDGPTRTVYEARAGLLCVRNASGDPLQAGLHVIPEIGLSMLTYGDGPSSAAPSTYLALGGVGVGYGNQWAAIAFSPRLMLGSDGAPAYGLRTGLTGRFLMNLLSVEVAHQLLAQDGAVRQGVLGMVSVNALVLLLYAH